MSNVTKAKALKSWTKKIVLSALLLATVVSNCPKAQGDEIDFSTYAAVAYSESTGAYGYAWDQPSYGWAERTALANCDASDAKIVGWVKGGWLVLAIGDNNGYGVAWEYGDGSVNGVAIRRAEAECLERANKVRKLVVLCSGDINPRIYEFE